MYLLHHVASMPTIFWLYDQNWYVTKEKIDILGFCFYKSCRGHTLSTHAGMGGGGSLKCMQISARGLGSCVITCARKTQSLEGHVPPKNKCDFWQLGHLWKGRKTACVLYLKGYFNRCLAPMICAVNAKGLKNDWIDCAEVKWISLTQL